MDAVPKYSLIALVAIEQNNDKNIINVDKLQKIRMWYSLISDARRSQ